jgi:hypothetical protein
MKPLRQLEEDDLSPDELGRILAVKPKGARKIAMIPSDMAQRISA